MTNENRRLEVFRRLTPEQQHLIRAYQESHVGQWRWLWTRAADDEVCIRLQKPTEFLEQINLPGLGEPPSYLEFYE